ncbi:MAG: ABC transporter permease [Candidatus Thorarchaeota archaeon]
MNQKRVVSGVFLQLKPSKETFSEKQGKWWIAFILIVGITIIFLIGLFGFALTAFSGIGLFVVGYTFLFGIVLLVTSAFRRVLIKQEVLTKGRANFVFVFVSAIMFVISYVIGFLGQPAAIEESNLGVSLAVGGVTLSLIIILVFDIYPVLSERGSPGYISMAGLMIVFSVVYMTAISWWIVPYDPSRLDVGPYGAAPSAGFPLGTTTLGQDLLSRVITGGSIMLQVAILSVVVCFSIGVPVGLAASYSGGLVDRGTSLVMDSIFAFPGLVLALAIAAMLGPGVVNMALAIAVVYIPSYFRVIRSQVLTVKELPYVEAAIVMGARNREILFNYILPNVLPSAIVVMSINFADAILTAAGLTFIGLGLPVDVPDWGWDLTWGFKELVAGKWWSITFPGLMIVILALGFTMAGEGLNEVLTPKLKE